MILHDDAFRISPSLVRALLDDAAPAQWRSLPLEEAGHGTDNVMMRLGDDLVVRVPQRAEAGQAIVKEARWLSRLDGRLPLATPRPRLVAPPSNLLPCSWGVYEWLAGSEPTTRTVSDWERFGRDVAQFVRALHAVDVSGEEPSDAMTWYRGQPLADFADDGVSIIRDDIAALARRAGPALDIARLTAVWSELASTPQALGTPVLLHGDLRAANLLVHDGHLSAVIDFGTLSIGQPAAEHGTIWDFPATARDAYRNTLGLTDDEWALSLGWTLLPALTGLPYYWDSWPEFARSCLDRIRLVMDEVSGASSS